MASTPTQAAATERATRTLWQGLGIDILVAVAAALLTWLPDADVLNGAAWLLLGTVLLKTVLQAAASYVMRLKIAPIREATLEAGVYDVTDGTLPSGTQVRHTTELVYTDDEDGPQH